MTIVINEKFMEKTLERADELQQEMIHKSKQIINSEIIIKEKMEIFIKEYAKKKEKSTNIYRPKYKVI